MLTTSLLSLATLAIFAAGLCTFSAAAHKRHLLAGNCAPQISNFTARRKAKRDLARRNFEPRAPSLTVTAADPHYTELQNTTCVTAPEVTEGPYYINNELVRQDLTEDQSGIQLVLDIGVLDTTTCEPLSNAFVEIWAANATGFYGSYGTMSGGPPVERRQGPGGPGGGAGGGSQVMARNETFLRGGLATDDAGITELITIYPGYYTGRTAHIHTMVHLNWESSANGTLVSHAGSLVHIGQFFFDEDWNDQIYAIDPYTTTTQSRTYNEQDSILQEENSNGNSAYVGLELLGSDLSNGLLGYITVGVNSTASYTIMNTNYLNSTGA
ncbi:aromatic compound dioxygenase [Armillaria novae-zelandiae]|uniref:Aromatic compound dioxygenase n=1 Tax=Armillaria novae-zelandiae TaxID=153914 RepID=A0AA39NVN5_9AGAR|nr:aromatic compound dioxygenase [Armillaria novae-zelandiae]